MVRCARGPRDGVKRVRECVFGGDLDLLTLVCTRGRDPPWDCGRAGCAPLAAGRAGCGSPSFLRPSQYERLLAVSRAALRQRADRGRPHMRRQEQTESDLGSWLRAH